MNRKKALIINGSMSLVYQIVTLLCGLVLPRKIIITFGSDINGVIASITQFIGIATLIQGGVTSAVRVAMYRPLSMGDKEGLSSVYFVGRKYFNRLVLLLFVYVTCLMVFFPSIVTTKVSRFDCCLLVGIIGLIAIVENLFGILDQLVLFADQKGYINTIALIFFTIISTIVSVHGINKGMSIITIKFLGGAILMTRPIAIHFYVRKKYDIGKYKSVQKDISFQSKEALAKSIAFFVHYNTDNMIISIVMGGAWASVYAVHRYIFGSVSSLISAILGNTEATFGNMLVSEDTACIERDIPMYDLVSKIVSTILFSTTMVLIVPFVELYTRGISDINYSQREFALIMCLGEMVYTMSLTYNNLIMAAGHIKETKWISIVEACINLIISAVLVNRLGIIGVGIGTLCAFMFNTIANYLYVNKNICKLQIKYVLKSYLAAIMPCVITIFIFKHCNIHFKDYLEFVLLGSGVVFVTMTVSFISVMLIYNKQIISLLSLLKMRWKKKSGKD